ncbi:GALNT16 [Symbiodinium pilosum]|uniref:GALNT16 protein n=1 Tax=Symbiodinium pilosum TaxID=2952 RepID=A0A812K6D1_SYMPI|nr:GALNT16 [Symbiodinium pilosum]
MGLVVMLRQLANLRKQDCEDNVKDSQGFSEIVEAAATHCMLRKRYGPFLTFLVCVYLAQTVLCVTLGHVRRAAHHTAEAVKPDSPIKTISVVMAAHNEHAYLKRTLDSVLETTPPETLVEIIVIDDGSEPLLEPITKKYAQVKLIRHDVRRGLIKLVLFVDLWRELEISCVSGSKFVGLFDVLPPLHQRQQNDCFDTSHIMGG